ncbi:hypothetical protein GCM10009557_46490 [Virgisporangium ochraceum]|jgi:hypothetical protein|uniref:Uncharacterized protein n=1 Tax=Virgisporangium ochraceum TaxID=65505 RepID=A0A8J3ZX13_9ACTN|nr:hypothetical protein [Virgisporangium ochraceum]GIJ70035.1 hypothetical protein Voc01_049520 [Virgisporangium ochraceum]
MLAIVAAAVLGLALILDLANVGLGSTIDLVTFIIVALLLMALHLGGVGSHLSGRTGGWRTRRRSRV